MFCYHGNYFGSHMFEATLFLGFSVDDSFSHSLGEVSEEKISLFVRDDDGYLTEIFQENKRYLGRYVGDIIDLDNLALIEVNIHSILKKLVPNYPYGEFPLLLFPIINSS